MKSTSNDHARATSLAHDAMNAQAALAGGDTGESSYARSQDSWEQRRLAMREEGLARSRAHNQELHEQGHIRRHGGYQMQML